MKVVQIIPGTGGTFYCQNCLRDSALMRGLQHRGVDVLMVPLYLPLIVDAEELADDVPVFFGGINVYLQQQFGLFRHTPRWVDRFFDSPWMLRQAAAREGTTSAADLGPMTLSMLQGRDGKQRKEVDRLTAWLTEHKRPDIVHISNSLLLGVASEIKRALNVPIVCSLQDEDTWLDAMTDPWAARCWEAMSERGRDVDMFLAVSKWYADKMKQRMNVPDERMTVVPVGIELDDGKPAPEPVGPPTIGYLSRMSRCLGLGVLADAFIELKRDPRFKDLRLRAIGGHTAEDESFLAELRERLQREGVDGDVEFLVDFEKSKRRDFLQSLFVLSVPAPEGEAFGVFILEALAAGVPVVQPDVGAFPEVVEATGGGVVYDAQEENGLAKALASLLEDPAHARELGARGRANVLESYSIDKMTERTLAIYESLVGS
jgi:glycosyltransferase involved in cell wall biosynthesis